MFLNNDTVVVGGESSTAEVHSLIEKKLITSWECHQTRIRCMLMMTSSDSSLLVTASSSDQKIKVWDVSRVETGQVECVAEVDTTCRVTSLAVWHPGMRESKKKKKVVEEVSESPVKKKVKVVEDDSNANKVTETITVEEEENDTLVVKTKSKKKNKKKSVELSS